MTTLQLDSSSKSPDPSQPTGSKRVYLSPPDMTDLEWDALRRAFDSGWVAPIGPEIDAFEAEFADYVGVKYAVAVSSGTAALHLALQCLDIGSMTEVITASLTFVATPNAIRYAGSSPVFVDSETLSWNIDAEHVERAVLSRRMAGKKVSAVMAVDLFGQCADYEKLKKVCHDYNLYLIEDAAEALGATRSGKPAGAFGDLACFSFNGNKIITTSGGGMLVTDNPDWAKRAKHLATQARVPAPHYQHDEIGYNYRISNLLAAIGRAQLSRLDEIVAKRRRTFATYQRTLDGLPGLTFMPEPADSSGTRWLTCATIDPVLFGCERNDVIAALAAKDIESRPVWKPMHLQPVYGDSPIFGGDVAEKLFATGICFPSGSSLSDEDLGRVCRTVQECQAEG